MGGRALVDETIELGEVTSFVGCSFLPFVGASSAGPPGRGGLRGRGWGIESSGADALIGPGGAGVEAGRIVVGAVGEGGESSGGALEVLGLGGSSGGVEGNDGRDMSPLM